MKKRSLKSDLIESDLLNDEQLFMVHLIRKNIRNALCSVYKSPRERALSWIYENYHTPGDLTLIECCHVLDLPVELIRIRMQYELYYNRISQVNLDCELPKVIIDELEYFLGDKSINAARKIWQNPGINVKQINEHTTIIIELMKHNLVMMNETQDIWFTCRNPIEYKNLNWAKCWSFYD